MLVEAAGSPDTAAPTAAQPTPVPTSQRARRGSQAGSVRSGTFDLHFFTDPRCEEEAPEACKLRTPLAAAVEEAATVVGSPAASWVASSGAAGEKLPPDEPGSKDESRAEEVIYVGLVYLLSRGRIAEDLR